VGQQAQAQFLEQLVGRIQALPGVQAASVSRGVRMNDWAGWSFITADNPNPPRAKCRTRITSWWDPIISGRWGFRCARAGRFRR